MHLQQAHGPEIPEMLQVSGKYHEVTAERTLRAFVGFRPPVKISCSTPLKGHLTCASMTARKGYCITRYCDPVIEMQKCYMLLTTPDTLLQYIQQSHVIWETHNMGTCDYTSTVVGTVSLNTLRWEMMST